MSKAHFDFDAAAKTGSGHWVTEEGVPVQFLPEIPGNSPPHELIFTGKHDHASADGHTHYLIGGDAAVVAQIVAWYESKGHSVPAGYAQAAADHAAAVEAAKNTPTP